jgi:(5-formylfuran-3-yl)methyl phosphate synthase
MTAFLASVRDAAEAEIALGSGADVIDLKDPARGALGALDRAAIAACATHVGARAPVSATVGDLPMHAETIRAAVRAISACGVDYIKLGIFPHPDARRCLAALASETRSLRLILVLFADAMPDFDAVAQAARIGAKGVMLDTAGKGGGALPKHISHAGLARFIAAARTHGLTVGLAGALRPAHVEPLLRLKPDLLGFRGALCRGETRTAPIDARACAHVRALIPRLPRTSLPKTSPEPGLIQAAPQALC